MTELLLAGLAMIGVSIYRASRKRLAADYMTAASLRRLMTAHERGYIGRDLVVPEERLRMHHQRVVDRG